jgi:hypothetical protein
VADDKVLAKRQVAAQRIADPRVAWATRDRVM